MGKNAEDTGAAKAEERRCPCRIAGGGNFRRYHHRRHHHLPLSEVDDAGDVESDGERHSDEPVNGPNGDAAHQELQHRSVPWRPARL
jgi:hypothetical protein